MEIFRMSYPPNPPKDFLVPKVFFLGGGERVVPHIHVPKKVFGN